MNGPLTHEETISALAASAGLIVLLAAGEYLRRIFRRPPEFSRKTVHIGAGLLVAFAPLLFERAAPVLMITGAFTALNIFAYATGRLKSVHRTTRGSYGTVYYPVSFFILTVLFWEENPGLVTASMLVLALGDGLAGAVGESLKRPISFNITSDGKSVQGSAVMFLSSVAAIAAAVYLLPPPARFSFPPWPFALSACVIISVALFATVWEAASSGGLDNVTVPLMSAFALWLSVSTPDGSSAVRFVTACLLAASVGAAAYRLKLLSLSGAAATFLLAVVIYASGGWELTLPIFTFFILSSALSRLGRARKRRLDSVFEKGSTRDLRQVAANGGVAGLIAALCAVWPDTAWYTAYLGSVAAVTADTWSTELGVLLSNRPRHLLTMRPVPRGTSGGVSPAGTLGGALGTLLIGLAGAAFRPEILLKPLPLVLFVLAGVAASLVDSLIGATVQAQYECAACGAATEKRRHCGAPALLRRGRRWITNDVVNTACAGAGAILGWLVGFFL